MPMQSTIDAVVLTPDGILREVQLPADSSAQLAELYRLIGCSAVDVVRLTSRLDMWLDDEGLLVGKPVNRKATLLAQHFGYRHQPYVGTVVLTGSGDATGDTTSLSADLAMLLPDLTHW